MMQPKLFITKQQPTTIIADFHTFLHYFIDYSPKLTKTKQQLARKDLRILSMRLPNLGFEAKETDPQSSYPAIHLFTELALKLQLLKKEFKESNLTLTLNEQLFQRFSLLTPTEQYVTLLQCFWIEADWRKLQGGLYSRVPYGFDFLLEEIADLPVGAKLRLSRYNDLRLRLHEYGYFLLYFSYFGLWDVTLDVDVNPRTIVRAKSLTLLPLLQRLTPILCEYFNEDMFSSNPFSFFLGDERDEIEQREELPPFLTQLQPLVKDGQLTTVLQDYKAPIAHGEYLFKVSLHSCWRTIALSDEHTLADLHNWIQTAFDFDDDHLYAFYMDNVPFSQHYYNSPMDVGPFAESVTIGELRLEIGQQFLYLFDFGDEWHFAVQLQSINANKTSVEARIVKEKGEAPAQYGYYDEDEDDY